MPQAESAPAVAPTDGATTPVAAAPAPTTPPPTLVIPIVVTTPEAAAPATPTTPRIAVDAEAPRGNGKAKSAIEPTAPEGANNTAPKMGAAPNRAAMAAAKEAFAPISAAEAPDVGASAPSNAAPATSGQSVQAQHVALEASVARAAPIAAQVGREIVRRFNGESARASSFGSIRRNWAESKCGSMCRVIIASPRSSPPTIRKRSPSCRVMRAIWNKRCNRRALISRDDGLSFDLAKQHHEGAESEQRGRARPRGAEPSRRRRPSSHVRSDFERWRGVRVDVMA